MIIFLKKPAVMLALLTAVSGSVSAVESQIDTKSQEEPAYINLIKKIKEQNSLDQDLYQELISEICNAVNENNTQLIKDIASSIDIFNYNIDDSNGGDRGVDSVEYIAFREAFQTENLIMLKAIFSLPCFTKNLGDHLSYYFICAIKSNNVKILDFLSHKNNLGNINQDYGNNLFDAMMRMCMGESNSYWKAVVDFTFDHFAIKPTPECINKCLMYPYDTLKYFENDNSKKYLLDNSHNSIRILLDKCKEKIYPENWNKILDMYVKRLSSCQRGTPEYDTAVEMIARMPFSKEALDSPILADYLDANTLSDKGFYKIMATRKDEDNSPFAKYLIGRYLTGKKDVSEEAMNNVIKNNSLEKKSNTDVVNDGASGLSGHLKHPLIKMLSQKPAIHPGQSRHVMQFVSEYLGNPRIVHRDLSKLAVAYKDQLARQGINGESEPHEDFTYDSENEVVAVNKDQEESKNEFLDGNDKQQRVRSKSQENKPTALSVSQAERDDWANEVD